MSVETAEVQKTAAENAENKC